MRPMVRSGCSFLSRIRAAGISRFEKVRRMQAGLAPALHGSFVLIYKCLTAAIAVIIIVSNPIMSAEGEDFKATQSRSYTGATGIG